MKNELENLKLELERCIDNQKYMSSYEKECYFDHIIYLKNRIQELENNII